MTLCTTIHLYNVLDEHEPSYAEWFDGPHRQALARLRGFHTADRYVVAPAQVMPDILQPWRFLSVYDFDLPDPAIDIPALGPLLAEARDQGWIAPDDSERIFSYEMFSGWQGSTNWERSEPFSGVSIILANYVPGHFAAYTRWYDDVHSHEVTNVPGHVAMKRGALSMAQVRPRRHCPGEHLVMCAQQTDDLAFTIGDFSARAQGRSPSGIAMLPRSKAASIARTVHYFTKISGRQFWPGGVAYSGDMSPYGR